MGKIKRLRDEVFKKIAAGEVIERPASAVKELVENAIDAGADLIEVELYEGGKELIKISDNGEGFQDDDIELAFKSHSTSKIREISDFDSLKTLGFRGEALPSIIQVSKIDLRTSSKKEGVGWFYSFVNGKVEKKEKIVFKTGTEILVKELFYNFPVRKKFLKSERTELNRISAIMESIAMINWKISFRLTNNRKEIFFFGRTETLKDRIYQVLGSELFKSMLEINYSYSDYSIGGMASRINTGSSVKKHQYYFVNNRPVREASFIASVNNTYRKYLEKNKFPVAVFSLKLPAGEVDVNIHPMKQEIKFHNNNFIYNFVKNAIQNCFNNNVELDVETEMNLKNFRNSSVTESNIPDGDINKSTSLELLQNKPLAFPIEEKEEEYKILGQFKESFIIIEMNSKLLIIDQHNAHERINYDYLDKFQQDKETQPISPLFPIIIELTPLEVRSFDAKIEKILCDLGFDIRRLSGNTIDVKTYPWFIEEKNIKDVVVSVLHLEDRGTDLYTKVIGDIACKNSIKINHKLYDEEMKKIVVDLFKSSNPYFCPHKRPIIKEFSLEDIEKMLKRK